jgi:Sulfotransferase family
VISRDKKFIFIHIPKTAGTSISDIITDPSCELLPNQHDKGLVLNHLTLKRMVEHRYVTAEEVENFFVFAFVRNPWDRALSDLQYLESAEPFKGRSFEERLKIYCELPEYHAHILPQVDFFDGYWDHVNFIGRFENIEADFKLISEKLDIKKPLPHLNKSSPHAYRKLLTTQQAEAIASKYEKDIKMFGYEY